VEIANSLWVEKYRPKKLDELVLPESYKKDFEICIQKKEISSLLLSGSPGSGKTTLTRILCSPYGVIQNPEDNVLSLNGSAKETRSINYVNEVIEPYLKIPPASPDKYKIVFIDEADFLTDAAFSSMRNIMEKYSTHGRFVLTCNYISKIPTAIQSRCQHYIFKQMPIEFVMDHCKKILANELIAFEEKDVRFVVDGLYPDIRRIVNNLQKGSLTGKLITNKDTATTTEKIIISNVMEIINFIQNNEDHKIGGVISNIVKTLGEIDLDFRSIYSDLFFRDKVPTTAKIIINKYSNSHNDCLIPHMHFLAMVFDVIQVLQKYKQLKSGK
jgi:replication factor C small subunit